MTAHELMERIARLDSATLRPVSVEALGRIFVETMSEVSFRGTPVDSVDIVDPDWADVVVAGSHVISQLFELAAWLWAAPMADACEQRWIATGNPPWAEQASTVPSRENLLTADSIVDLQTAVAARQVGLYTSSATEAYTGMWSQFIELNSTDVLWTRPWTTWRLEPSPEARILQVSTAKDWAALVQRHHIRRKGHLYADWRAVAETHDALHFSPSAVCAVEGFAVECDAGLIAPTYWDVEFTLWLRWCFISTVQVGAEP